jgi:predicted small secreted protein
MKMPSVAVVMACRAVFMQLPCGRIAARWRPFLKEAFIMNRQISFGLALVMLLAAAPLLSACHTVAGAGEDVQATGHAVDKAATRNTP